MELQRDIFNSARDGDLDRLKAMLDNKSGEEVSLLLSARTDDYTPLLVACMNNHLDVASYLIDICRADVEQAGTIKLDGGEIQNGASPLWCASYGGHLNVVKFLLRHKASVNSTTKSNSTPLHAACGLKGHLEIVKCLVEHEADIEIADKTNRTCLMLSCIGGHYEISKYLVERGADVNRKGKNGMTALHECAELGHLSILMLLVENGANINSDSSEGTPLMLACNGGHYEISEYLVERGADVNRKYEYGMAALHECAQLGHLNILILLVENGADINSDSREGTPLMLACSEDDYEMSKYLLEKGADVNRKCEEGRTALHVCAKWNYLDTLKLLLQNEAAIIADSDGETPLLTAALAGHEDTVEYFIQEFNFTRQAKINALEILGATFVDQNRDMNLALNFWRRAMELRHEDGDFLTENLPRLPPIAACVNATEVRTLSQLEDLRLDPYGMRCQALVVTERILGPEHPVNLSYIRRRGEAYANDGDLDRSKKLWMYALDALPKDNPEELRVFLEDFSRMSASHVPLDRGEMVVFFSVLLRAFERVLKDIEREKKASETEHEKSNDACFNETLYNAVFALGLMCELQPLMIHSEKFKLMETASQLVHKNPITYEGMTTLHVACFFEAIFQPPESYNPLEVVNLLLKVGADTNALDFDDNTPLHMAAMKKSCSQVLIDTLLGYGAHPDLCNRENKTFQQLLEEADQRIDVNPLRHLNLKCLSAKAVRRHKIPYEGLVHEELEEFMDLH